MKGAAVWTPALWKRAVSTPRLLHGSGCFGASNRTPAPAYHGAGAQRVSTQPALPRNPGNRESGFCSALFCVHVTSTLMHQHRASAERSESLQPQPCLRARQPVPRGHRVSRPTGISWSSWSAAWQGVRQPLLLPLGQQSVSTHESTHFSPIHP